VSMPGWLLLSIAFPRSILLHELHFHMSRI
jgi:hypothetical protein